MSQDFRCQLGDAAKHLGMRESPSDSNAETPGLQKPEIKLNDKVYLKTGANLLQQYRNPGGKLRQLSIGETVRMGYKDKDAGFIVKQIMDDPIYGKVVEIEPVQYSYQKDQGSTYLVLLENVGI